MRKKYNNMSKELELTKQIVYPKIIPRIFSLLIDFMILSLVLNPLTVILSRTLFLYVFQDFFISNGIDTSNPEIIAESLRSENFVKYAEGSYNLFNYFLSMLILNITILGFYFVGFWYKFEATPGKMIMRMRIVNADDFSHPSLYSYIKRYFSYMLAAFSIFTIFFDKKHRAVHDKIAGTIVIKK